MSLVWRTGAGLGGYRRPVASTVPTVGDWRALTVKKVGCCSQCGRELPVGEQVVWSRSGRAIQCLEHHARHARAEPIAEVRPAGEQPVIDVVRGPAVEPDGYGLGLPLPGQVEVGDTTAILDGNAGASAQREYHQ